MKFTTNYGFDSTMKKSGKAWKNEPAYRQAAKEQGLQEDEVSSFNIQRAVFLVRYSASGLIVYPQNDGLFCLVNNKGKSFKKSS